MGGVFSSHKRVSRESFFFKLLKPCQTFALALVCMILRLARAARLMSELFPDWFVGLVVDQFRIDQDMR